MSTMALGDLPPIAKPEQVAAFLQVSIKTVLRMIEDARLKAARTHPGRGGRWRIKREDVFALMEVHA